MTPLEMLEELRELGCEVRFFCCHKCSHVHVSIDDGAGGFAYASNDDKDAALEEAWNQYNRRNHDPA
jgi:hypothetical protein